MMPVFVMNHKENTMLTSTLKLEDVWFVDSRASNQMTSHEKWFQNMREPGYVETGDD